MRYVQSVQLIISITLNKTSGEFGANWNMEMWLDFSQFHTHEVVRKDSLKRTGTALRLLNVIPFDRNGVMQIVMISNGLES